MNFLNVCSIIISRQTCLKYIRKRNFKHFLSISSSSNYVLPQNTYRTTRWLKHTKSIFGLKHIDYSVIKSLHFLKLGQKTLRRCSVNPSWAQIKTSPVRLKELISFIKNSPKLETFAVPVNKKTVNMIGEINTLRKLSLIFEDDFQDFHLLQKLKYKVQSLRNLRLLDMVASGSTIHCLSYLYKQVEVPYIGVSVNRNRINDKLSFLGTSLVKLQLTSISLQLVTQIMQRISTFENLQSLSIKRIEETFPENFSFKEFSNLKSLYRLKDFTLNISLGSVELTQNLLNNIRFPISLENLYLWLTGVCLTDRASSLSAYENFSESLKELRNLTSFPLLLDFKSGLGYVNLLMRYFPRNMVNMKTFRLFTSSSDYCQRAYIDLPDLLDIISPMKGLDVLFLNFEDISLAGKMRNLEGIKQIRYLYILSTSTKVSSLNDYHKLIDFVEQNRNLRNLTFECSPDFLSKKEINKLADMLKSLKNLEHLSLRIKVKDVLIDSFYALGEVMRTLKYLKERFIEVTWQSISSENFNESMCAKIFSPHWKFIMNCISIHDEKGRQLYRVRS